MAIRCIRRRITRTAVPALQTSLLLQPTGRCKCCNKPCAPQLHTSLTPAQALSHAHCNTPQGNIATWWHLATPTTQQPVCGVCLQSISSRDTQTRRAHRAHAITAAVFMDVSARSQLYNVMMRAEFGPARSAGGMPFQARLPPVCTAPNCLQGLQSPAYAAATAPTCAARNCKHIKSII